MSDNEWRPVVNIKRQKKRLRQKEQEAEKNKWEKLKNEYPHIVLPSRAKRLQEKLNIDELEKKLISDEFIEHQTKGWNYVKVMKPSDITKGFPDGTENISYSSLKLNNGWGDCVLFKKSKIIEHEFSSETNSDKSEE